jgi:hypothetical protein
MGLFKDCGCGCGGRKQQEKFMASIMSALLFFLIANPETFILVRRIFGNWVASATGYPTMLGLVLHSVVFMLIVWGLMNIKRENADGVPAPSPAGPPPQPVPEGPAEKDGMLPDEPGMEQPMYGISEPTPASSLLPSPSPSPMVTEGTMSKMSNMLGGQDISSSSLTLSPVPPVYGTNWRQCSCGDGTQVMIMK